MGEQRQERILLVRLSHLGDIVHALPVYHALRQRFPRAALAWAVQDEFADLVSGLSGVAESIVFERRGGARAWLAVRERLARFGATLAVDAQGNLKSALVTLASGAGSRFGMHPVDWRERSGALCLTDWAPRTPTVPGSPGHALDRMFNLARAIGRLPVERLPRFDPELSPREIARAPQLLSEVWPEALEAHHGVILHVSSRHDPRAWPLEHAAALVRFLTESGTRVLVLSGPGEAGEGRELAARLPGGPNLRHWIGQRGLRELATFLGAAATVGARFVGSDSGPLHLAVACGMDVLVLAGPQDEGRTGPWPLSVDRARRQGAGTGSVVRVQRAVRAAPGPECAPCRMRRCHHALGPVCMRELEPERVLAALRSRNG